MLSVALKWKCIQMCLLSNVYLEGKQDLIELRMEIMLFNKSISTI